MGLHPTELSNRLANLGKVHAELTSLSYDALSTFNPESEDISNIDDLLCSLLCDMSYVRALESFGSDTKNVNKICQDACQRMNDILQTLFQTLTNPTPRGQYIEF